VIICHGTKGVLELAATLPLPNPFLPEADKKKSSRKPHN
jgi:hypothetical protein